MCIIYKMPKVSAFTGHKDTKMQRFITSSTPFSLFFYFLSDCQLWVAICRQSASVAASLDPVLPFPDQISSDFIKVTFCFKLSPCFILRLYLPAWLHVSSRMIMIPTPDLPLSWWDKMKSPVRQFTPFPSPQLLEGFQTPNDVSMYWNTWTQNNKRRWEAANLIGDSVLNIEC